MKKCIKLFITILFLFLIIGCNNERIDESNTVEVDNCNSMYQNLIPFNNLIKKITFEKVEDETITYLDVPTELKFLYEANSYIDKCCYLSFNANISLNSYTELVRGYTIKKFVNNPNYHYVEKDKEANISDFSTSFQYNNNYNILSNCTKRYDLYKNEEFQLVSFIINNDNSVYILLLKNELEEIDSYQIEQGFVIKGYINEKNDSFIGETTEVKSQKFIECLNYNPFKGLELFAWLENNEWKLVLLEGTNRKKTVNELKEGLILNTTDMEILIKNYQDKDVHITIILIEELSLIESNEISSNWIIQNDELKSKLKKEIGWKDNEN